MATIWPVPGGGGGGGGAYEFNYLVVGGGGGGGGTTNNGGKGAGGGAGGYRNSTSGEQSGGGAEAEQPLRMDSGDVFGVAVGAGSPGSSSAATQGNASTFAQIISIGGGGGSGYSGTYNGTTGGSGGGGENPGLAGVLNQGYSGGTNVWGGGGGAGEAGDTDGARQGGDGLYSSITGTSVARGGGGGGYAGGGGEGGGGYNNGTTAYAGTVNTGGGGGGGGQADAPNPRSGASGGSGVVILKYPDTLTLTAGPGLTSSTTSSGGLKITTFTAGNDIVTIG